MTAEVHLLRLPDVCQRTGLSKTTVYQRERDGAFPKRLKLGARLSVWRSDEIAAYIEKCTASARGDAQ
ncbi:helix-turn-helix transcriptional regulator [Solimonas marina]|uniref:AlpA family transcriptional regulator n=1 Tax=Solimonas marina TaxID=2714601 RepID=A0A969W9Y1_9GAMM|nr:AlpA family transcriptional regulator [Solimonas marina]NKF23067.1 AlpA family transcriptional regulator [Solimonas marina]